MAPQPDVTVDRHLGIGGSDARRIMEGDWLPLYREKVGESQPEDLSGIFKVQLGSFTEPFHLDWLEQREGWTISCRNLRFLHDQHSFMFAHIDGMITDLSLPIEVKHSNSRATARETAVFYMAQLQHIIEVTGADAIKFSLIAGNEDPEVVTVDRNEEYITALIDMERSFWWHVENNIPPEITPTGKQEALKIVAASTPIDKRKPYDMTTSNEWAVLAADYTANQQAAALFEEAKAGLKALVPEDASQCSGHGILIKRDKRGALRFS